MMDKIEFETEEIYLLKNMFELAYKSASLCEDEHCSNLIDGEDRMGC